MERIPLEILTKIFADACIDSGATGCNLSLVSRFIREASAPIKLQSVGLRGSQQIIAFHRSIILTPPHLRRIRYLYISTDPLPPPQKRRYFARLIPSRWRRDDTEPLRQACVGILEKIAGHVEIMFFDVATAFLGTLPNMLFPRLVELTSDGFPLDSYHSYYPPGPFKRSHSMFCPKLRRWHLMGHPQVWWRSDVVKTLYSIAPSITHLRFSGIYSHECPLHSPYDALYENRRQDHEYEVPATPPSTRPQVNPKADFQMLLVRREDGNIGCLLQIYSEPNHSPATIPAEWSERVNGIDGFWSLTSVLPTMPAQNDKLST